MLKTKSSMASGIVLLFCLIFNTFNVNAQNERAEVEKVVRDFAKAYENVTKSKDKESVLKFVSRDLFSTIVNSNVIDNFGLIQSSYSDFEKYITHLATTDGMAIKYNIDKVLKTHVRGRTGVVVCDISVQVSDGKTIWSRGSEATVFTLKKFNDGWKILHFSVTSLEEELNKGTCLCEMFVAKTGDIVSKSIVPAGTSYSHKLDNFEIRHRGGPNFNIAVGENRYEWVRDGEIRKIESGGSSTVIGKAIDEHQAVLTILLQDLYKKECTEFRRKN
ncbi:MAG: hypothetical protein JJU28_18340 [Cyclobacteriaceae bacterium]|nr:hypothetical protein [Cyclobacteriaceae bacterium]